MLLSTLETSVAANGQEESTVLTTSRRAPARLFVSLAGACIALIAVTPAMGAGLPDARGYELVSPADKLGHEVIAESSRTRAAAFETMAGPAGVTFASLGGFADVHGTGIATEYLSQRDGRPGTNGWSAHGITPLQEPLPFFGAFRSLEPLYDGEFSPDLSKGVFKAWSPLTDAPNVRDVVNLYVREDLRRRGAGIYRLLTNAAQAVPGPSLFPRRDPGRPRVSASTDDFQHVLFESRDALTADAIGNRVKLYKSDGAQLRLVSVGAGCGGGFPPGQCSAAGLGTSAFRYTPRVLSEDGTRAMFSTPVGSTGDVAAQAGAETKLFQLDDRGTAATVDDAVVQINASEKATPDTTRVARYQIASIDGSRVFFTSDEELTDSPGGGLYLWERQATNETQAVTVDATGGTFRLTFSSHPSTGVGELADGSDAVSSVQGSFAVGQAIAGVGIPPGTTIVAKPGTSSLTLSATATGSGQQVLRAAVEATTAALAHDATAEQVESALASLPGIGEGNVLVAGGPGGDGGASPYVVTFTGALAGVNVAPLSVNSSALTGGGETAAVATTRPLQNLARLVSLPGGTASGVTGVIGASEDGHHVYFTAVGGQLVAEGPALPEGGIYYWHDAGGAPGTLAFVGGVAAGDLPPIVNDRPFGSNPKVSRVTPDGRFLMFEVSDGRNLAPQENHHACVLEPGEVNPNNSGHGCSEAYVYRAATSSPLVPDLVCASCRPSGEPSTASAFLNVRTGGVSGTGATSHLSHALSDDGRRIFFSTAEALVPDDVNGKSDAYVFDVRTETVDLISSGRDRFDSYFLDASANGDDVYFMTREQLVGWDTDQAYDLYDARVGGGFPEPPAPPRECVGAACQGQAAAPPGAAALGSATFRGLGNARPARTRCRRGQVKRRIRGKRRCVRRGKGKRAKRRAAARRTR
jgi:hypothetical protein